MFEGHTVGSHSTPTIILEGLIDVIWSQMPCGLTREGNSIEGALVGFFPSRGFPLPIAPHETVFSGGDIEREALAIHMAVLRTLGLDAQPALPTNQH